MNGNNSPNKFFISANEGLLNTGLLLLRAVIGVILFMVGAGKVFGWFGGHGLGPTIHGYVTMMGISAPWAYISTFTELIGSILLIVGLLTRLIAVPVTVNMLVATIVSWPRGFLTGADLPFTLLGIAIIILLTGPGAYSLDALVFRSRGNVW